MAEKGEAVRVVDPGHGTKASAGVLLCTPLHNIPVAVGIAKGTSWSPKLISALMSAKSEQWLAAGLSSTDFNHHVLAVVFTLPMISSCIYSMFYLYRFKFLSY